MGDMSVTVGGSKCPITSLTEDTLVCEPPQTPQLVDGGGYASVMVSWDFLTLNSIMGDMSVTVGGSKCTITSLTEDTLVCEPPQTPQLVDGGGYASVMVSWDFLTLNSIMGDMSVTVGGSKCTITSLTEDTLVCEPPQTPQLVDGGGYASVMVSWDKNVPE